LGTRPATTEAAEKLNRAAKSLPQALKRNTSSTIYGTTEEAAEKLVEGAKGSPQALKRGHVFNGLRHD